MATIKQIRICGLGGQGIVFAGSVLGKAAILEGKWVSGANAYGSQARGGLARAEVVISDQPIKFPHIIETDVLIILSQSAYQTYAPQVKPKSGQIIYDRSLVTPDNDFSAKSSGINATDEALKEFGTKQVANIVILGAVNEMLNIVKQQSIVKTIQSEVPDQFLELNMNALELGVKLGGATK